MMSFEACQGGKDVLKDEGEKKKEKGQSDFCDD